MNYEHALKLWGASKLHDQTKASGKRKERIIDLDTVIVTINPDSAYLCYVTIVAYAYLASDKQKEYPRRYYLSIKAQDFSFSDFTKEVLAFSKTRASQKTVPLKTNKQINPSTFYTWD